MVVVEGGNVQHHVKMEGIFREGEYPEEYVREMSGSRHGPVIFCCYTFPAATGTVFVRDTWVCFINRRSAGSSRSNAPLIWGSGNVV